MKQTDFQAALGAYTQGLAMTPLRLGTEDLRKAGFENTQAQALTNDQGDEVYVLVFQREQHKVVLCETERVTVSDGTLHFSTLYAKPETLEFLSQNFGAHWPAWSRFN